MKMRSMFIAALLLGITAAAAYAASADDILGVWDNQEKEAKIEIVRCGDQYCGDIVWLREPNYPADSKEGAPGTPKLDRHNPDPANRKNPVIGLRIMHGFIFAGDGMWKDGQVYDPKNGKTYSGKVTLVSPHQLKLRGFIGISILGRTTIWTR